jgi:hypothetical protein
MSLSARYEYDTSEDDKNSQQSYADLLVTSFGNLLQHEGGDMNRRFKKSMHTYERSYDTYMNRKLRKKLMEPLKNWHLTFRNPRQIFLKKFS